MYMYMYILVICVNHANWLPLRYVHSVLFCMCCFACVVLLGPVIMWDVSGAGPPRLHPNTAGALSWWKPRFCTFFVVLRSFVLLRSFFEQERRKRESKRDIRIPFVLFLVIFFFWWFIVIFISMSSMKHWMVAESKANLIFLLNMYCHHGCWCRSQSRVFLPP